MKLTLRDFYITDKPYLTRKLDHSTLSKLMDSSFFVVDGIYQLKNDATVNVKLFEESKFDGFELTAYVKVNYAYAGAARAQVKNVKLFKKLLYRKPAYELRINLYDNNQKQIYYFSHKFVNLDRLYRAIDNEKQVLEAILSFVNTETK